MKIHPALVASAWLVAGCLILIPSLETVAAVWPLRFSETNWRFGAAGLLSRGLPLLLVGMLLVVGLVVLAGNRTALMVTSVVSAAVALLLLVGSGLFVLDTIQMRATVAAEVRRTFDAAALIALFKMGIAALALAGMAIGTWRTGRAAQPARTQRHTAPLMSTTARGS